MGRQNPVNASSLMTEDADLNRRAYTMPFYVERSALLSDDFE